MKFDVIIATFNRSESLAILVSQILECSKLPENIIIVDSSEFTNKNIQDLNLVKYFKSSHSNQPYQRYLGYKLSNNDILFYFDDDMRIKDKKCFEKLLPTFKNLNVVGIQPNFAYKHNFFDNKMPKSITRSLAKKNIIFSFLKKISGNPDIKSGKLWLSGIRGQRPENNKTLEWFNGPIFLAKREFLYNNFNFSLFNLYEKNLGKAEDVILGFTMSKSGDIVFLDKMLFQHDDQDDSTYSLDFVLYAKRVAYSRLYLSFEYARISKSSLLLAFLHFNLYTVGRILSLILNQIIYYETSRTQIIIGYLKGYIRALFDSKKLILFDNGDMWNNEVSRDISSNLKNNKYKGIE